MYIIGNYNRCPGSAIKTEAWVLRRLVSIFGGVARRPHRPRDPEMVRLFECIGIDLSITSPQGILDGLDNKWS